MDDTKKEEEGVDTGAFEALEKDFQEVLAELVGDKSLEHFRQEYEKLHRALKKSHDSEKHLIKKCRDLNSEIVNNAVKVQAALKLSQEDQSTITALKKEIERAWKMVEASHEKEQRAKDTIHNLKVEISNLSRLVEQGAGLSINQENTVNNLVQQKNDLMKHKDMLQGQVQQLTQHNTELFEKVAALEAEKNKSESELDSLKGALSKAKADMEHEASVKEQLDKQLKDLRQDLDEHFTKIKDLHVKLERDKQTIVETRKQVEEQHKRNQEIEDQEKRLRDETFKQQKVNDDERKRCDNLQQQKDELDAQLKTRQADGKQYQEELEQIRKQHETLQKKKDGDDSVTRDIVKQKDEFEAAIKGIAGELERLKKVSESDSKSIVDLLHERDILTKSVIRADDRTKDQVDLVQRHQGREQALSKDVQRWKKARAKEQARIVELEQQRDKYNADLAMVGSKYNKTLEDLKSRDHRLSDLKKAISDVKAKLAQQKNLYESVRTDRNLYSKNYIESQDEIVDMKRKFKLMTHQIDQLREEIKEKDQELNKNHFDYHRVNKTSELCKEKLVRAEARQGLLQANVGQQRNSIKKLEATIQEAEQERQNQRKEFEGVQSERDILGAQLVRRNEELALLYEKIKIQRSTLEKGEIQYREKLEDIRVLKGQIGQLKAELHISQQQVVNISDLKKEVYHLQRELLQERTKVKALSEELENPMNVHRWRKLEGSDPATYELIQKVRTLQKRLIAKTEEVVQKDVVISEKESLYNQLKNIIQRQPGPEVEAQLSVYQANLEEKKKQMRSMTTELRMEQGRVGDYRDEIDRLNRDLTEVKKKFYDQKRREQLTLQKSELGKAKFEPTPNPNQPRFTGGGFNLSI